ncbi:MAG: NimC/NimA family protein [Ruminococcus albus]|uniref:pyridoxamine 5'-phosphate oxidase family protein n=1 Tax=Ruminococcus sp. TaxID=41978 RepID=UPI0025F71C04|nr:pyridoxamine 5'-phosphate oxidase family protein [Ruminococcus sp.]MBE6873074.1 NimC/NimA family protein [Ruminococcus albus]MBR0528157.1 pyridoxamine 5'-phosphate oxidase family protein [Ruminococcus sp.]
MKEILEYLKSCGTFYIATCDGDQPRVRPFGAVCEFEGKLYIITNNKKDVYKQITADPKVEISGMKGGTWIRLSGELEEDTRREARVAMLEAYPELGNMYNVDDGVMTVFSFKSGKADICSFTDAPKSYTL